ncbi:exonuclease domain-containing protein [Shigella boydii]
MFHDYETFGTHPALDRPAQFAAIRTDSEFNVIGEPEVFYCKTADDYLPSLSSINYRYYPAGSTGEGETKPRLPPVFTRFLTYRSLSSGLQQCAF